MKVDNVATLVLAIHLIAVSWIDLRSMIIPNLLNLSLAICGVIVSKLLVQSSYWQTILEATIVYLFFSLIGFIYNKVRGAQGLGGGDIKLLSAATCWVGAASLAWTVLIASICGLTAVLIALLMGQSFDALKRIAFGPYLAIGLFSTWLLRDTLVSVLN